MRKQDLERLERCSYDLIDGGYCNKKEWYEEKERIKRKYYRDGFKVVKVIQCKSDTKGLRMYQVWALKEFNIVRPLDKGIYQDALDRLYYTTYQYNKNLTRKQARDILQDLIDKEVRQ